MSDTITATPPTSKPVLELNGLEHHTVDRNRDDSFILTVDEPIRFYPGQFTAIMGPSGCGKTTLMTILGLLRKPFCPNKPIGQFNINIDNQTYKIDQLWRQQGDRDLESLRRQYLGFALQSGELLDSLTVSENIAVPLKLNNFSKKECSARIADLLEQFDIVGQGQARINRLSGGQLQRIVLARSIVHNPRLVFVDEPTAALDRNHAREALDVLKQMQAANQFSTSVVMITHDDVLANLYADTFIRLEPEMGRHAGRVVSIEYRNSNAHSQEK